MPSSRDLPTQGLKLHLLCLLHLLEWVATSFSKKNRDKPGGLQSMGSQRFGRTEVIDNTLNPDFVRKFIVDYFFEEKQNLRFDLYDVDSKSPDLSKHDFLGQAFCTLGEIVGSPGSRLEKSLTGVPGKKCGTIILSAEELSNCRDVATMQFCANKLDKKDFFGKSDPFLVFYRSNEDGTFTICHKTEVMKNTLNPVWQTFSIPVRALCNGDYDRHDLVLSFFLSCIKCFPVVKNPPAKQKRQIPGTVLGAMDTLSYQTQASFWVSYFMSSNFTMTLEGGTSEEPEKLWPPGLNELSPTAHLGGAGRSTTASGVSDPSSHGCPCTQTEEAAWLPTVPALTSLPGPGRLAASLPLQSISETKNPWPCGADIYMLNEDCLGDGSLEKMLECFRWNKHVMGLSLIWSSEGLVLVIQGEGLLAEDAAKVTFSLVILGIRSCRAQPIFRGLGVLFSSHNNSPQRDVV
ncbi:hypothetical protein FD754_004804, partial [Muntiacus muntjak]